MRFFDITNIIWRAAWAELEEVVIGGGSSRDLIRNAEPEHHRASHWLVSERSVVFLKTVARLAYIRSGLNWDGPQTTSVANFLIAKGFPVEVDRNLREGPRNSVWEEDLEVGTLTQTPHYETVRRLARPEQTQFRADLINRYGARCAISGCTVEAVLDACHILSHEAGGPADVANGLVLRRDLHRLFDLGLVAVDPETLSWQFHPELGNHYNKIINERNVPKFERDDARLDRLAAHWKASQF